MAPSALSAATFDKYLRCCRRPSTPPALHAAVNVSAPSAPNMQNQTIRTRSRQSLKRRPSAPSRRSVRPHSGIPVALRDNHWLQPSREVFDMSGHLVNDYYEIGRADPAVRWRRRVAGRTIGCWRFAYASASGPQLPRRRSGRHYRLTAAQPMLGLGIHLVAFQDIKLAWSG